jgi:integrase
VRTLNFVEPIRSKETIEDIALDLKKNSKDDERDYIMFIFGIHTGLRISDMLKFSIKGVRNTRGYNIRETKTGKQKIYDWNSFLKRELDKYVEGKDDNEYLFKSRQGENKAITRQRAYQIIKRACNKFGVTNIGTHTLRKTFRISHL